MANLLEHDEGKTFLTVYNALAPCGYSMKYQVMDPLEYGDTPQLRTRIYMVAFLDQGECDRLVFPEKIPLKNTIENIIDRSIKHSDCYYYDSTHSLYNELKSKVKDPKAIYRIFDSGVSAIGHYNCPILMANMGTYPDRVPIIMDDFGIRKITPYECLALQDFPKEYRFPKIPLASAYKQCGNSVVVPVIRRIAEKI